VDKTEAEPITPDYAAGLTSVPPSPAPPSYAPPATPSQQPTVVSNESYSQMQPQMQTTQPTVQSAPPVQQRFVVNDNYVNQNADNSAIKATVKPMRAVTAVNTPLPPMVATPQLVQQLQTNPTPVQVITQPQSQLQAQLQVPPQPLQQLPQPPQQPTQPQQPFVRRQLQLSREQMLAAQEMFTNSNKVTRPEKALILGFMAGSRENPCPQLGNVVTIKLSEKEEDVRQSDQTIERMVVETHFQMNYNTGEWKKVQKLRKLDQNVQNAHTIHPYQTLQQTV